MLAAARHGTAVAAAVEGENGWRKERHRGGLVVPYSLRYILLLLSSLLFPFFYYGAILIGDDYGLMLMPLAVDSTCDASHSVASTRTHTHTHTVRS